MKKVFFPVFLVLSLSFSSCEKDYPIQKQDPIVGKWYLIDSYINGKKNILGPCDGTGFISFTAYGIINVKRYSQKSSDSKNCEKVAEGKSGRWKNMGDGRYQIISVSKENVTTKMEAQITFKKDIHAITYSHNYEMDGVLKKLVLKLVYKRK